MEWSRIDHFTFFISNGKIGIFASDWARILTNPSTEYSLEYRSDYCVPSAELTIHHVGGVVEDYFVRGSFVKRKGLQKNQIICYNFIKENTVLKGVIGMTEERNDDIEQSAAVEHTKGPEKKIVAVDDLLPRKLFVFPLRMRPIFPGIVAPVLVTDEPLKNMINDVMQREHIMGFVYLKNEVADITEIKKTDLYKVGTVARVFKKVELPDGSYNILVNTLKRFTIKKVLSMDPYITVAVEYHEEKIDRDDIELKALMQAMLADVKFIIENNPLLTEEMKLNLVNINEHPGRMVDIIVSILNVSPEEQQSVLELYEIKERIRSTLLLLNKEKEMLKLQNKIRADIEEKVAQRQRDFFLNEQLKYIKQELGLEKDEKTQDSESFRARFEKLKHAFNEETTEKVERELEKLELLEPASAEYGVVRSYLDTILSLPWDLRTEDRIDIARARKILNTDHYGLEDVKERILEFLAVRKIKPDSKGSIVLLVGPPGVGKTSVGKSLARAMGRKFFRFSLGGMRDEAEIKGHRRTYVGAMPGKIMQAMSIVKTINPVIMLDEIDKLGTSYQGDPSSALLEVLDPEQNISFRDHYLDVPFDLSHVLFVCTANTLDTIPRPLLDRMEMISLSGYIDEEKIEIGRRYLIPKSMKEHGIPKNAVTFAKSALVDLCRYYARQSGVRDLEKFIDKIMRKIALKYAEKGDEMHTAVSAANLEKYLGAPMFTKEEWQKISRPGMVRGLAWTSYGGSTLLIEAVFIEGKGGLKLTGQLGEVMSESASIAYSYAMTAAERFHIDNSIFEKKVIHIHLPEGATPKDGPSAGISLATAILSLLIDKKISNNFAMTGELSLTGHVLPVGGIREKVVAAKRFGVKEIIMPEANKVDFDKIPEKVREGITVHYVKRMTDVEKILFEPGQA